VISHKFMTWSGTPVKESHLQLTSVSHIWIRVSSHCRMTNTAYSKLKPEKNTTVSTRPCTKILGYLQVAIHCKRLKFSNPETAVPFWWCKNSLILSLYKSAVFVLAAAR
jgi:hypothetical protein